MKSQTGAEAVIHFSEDTVIKQRVTKPYRLPQLDDRLRKSRNKKEAKLLIEAPVRVPKVVAVDQFSITMERIHGPRLRDVLSVQNATQFGAELGNMIRKLHDKDIIHGDLTTSNILVEKNNDLVLIDFGLGTQSNRLEDKAVDLHVLRETLEGTHIAEKEIFWHHFETTYDHQPVLSTLKEVETRGRYKPKY